jgi:hypothetical protein
MLRNDRYKNYILGVKEQMEFEESMPSSCSESFVLSSTLKPDG